MKIGWCSTALEASLCFPDPKRVLLEKDKSRVGGGGFLSCPSVRHYFSSVFAIESPFSLQLTSKASELGFTIHPVYPFTSLTQARVDEFVKIEPRSTWRSPEVVVLQLPSPYLFFADEPVLICQNPVLLSTPSSFYWRSIPGKFNIYEWQRPLNWAFEWYATKGDFIIKTGEPIYFVSFEAVDGGKIGDVRLVKSEFSQELAKRVQQTRGVTSIRRGITPLFEAARQSREGVFFLEGADAE